LDKDKALVDTRFGKYIKNLFDIKTIRIETPIEEILQDGKVKNLVKTYEFISDRKFRLHSELTLIYPFKACNIVITVDISFYLRDEFSKLFAG